MIVDLVIPVYNEEAGIGLLFDALAPLREGGVIRRVVVGDNGSTDRSAQLAAERGAEVASAPNRGYGAACLAALRLIADRHSDESEPGTDPVPDAVAFLDADLSDDPRALAGLIRCLDTHDLVIGSRIKLADPGSLTPVQRFGSLVSGILLRLLTGHHYHDLGPMRVIRWKSLMLLDMQDTTWGWTAEMQAKAAMAGLRVAELDVTYQARCTGVSKISGTISGSLKAAWKILWTIVRIRLCWTPVTPTDAQGDTPHTVPSHS